MRVNSVCTSSIQTLIISVLMHNNNETNQHLPVEIEFTVPNISTKSLRNKYSGGYWARLYVCSSILNCNSAEGQISALSIVLLNFDVNIRRVLHK